MLFSDEEMNIPCGEGVASCWLGHVSTKRGGFCPVGQRSRVPFKDKL